MLFNIGIFRDDKSGAPLCHRVKISGKKTYFAVKLLTNNCQLHKVTSDWLSIDLTLVSTRVTFLDVFDLENPIVTSRIVDGLEAQISRIGIPTNCQNMQVMVSDPRYLQKQRHQHHNVSAYFELP
jgi:hypothetical protein